MLAIILIITLNSAYIQVNCSTLEGKVVYLTFDDGPSYANTGKILNILNKNGVKATFFVVGNKVVENKEQIKNLKKHNMAIYPHCNVHDYKKIYKNKEEYFKDLNICEKRMKSVLGENIKLNFVRLPGGSTNTVGKRTVINSIKKQLKEKRKMYIDWNIDSGDAKASNVSSNIIKNNIKKNSGAYKVEVVLMHDAEGKKSTVSSLQSIINEYKAMNYEFKTLDNISKEEIQYLKNAGVINRK
ncbi:polysaccharide deacetylase family protein [Eubacterium multiforme]|uniref:Peptidoglycan/xylan/chitin deacetylase (PgdA/CDA1 family) n=1 Tax=Eubacterium multiforme TaxID=83339 RepID=A0ABT9UR13_9FIRM|nr:polysaccharide deacetylase family protein [Eubacterium multiforme]MDQ0148423.1 peptidoglycan/xylan/chitin deacetylase (PgdA/CDA1 family) [Eubacterium multiforme]